MKWNVIINDNFSIYNGIKMIDNNFEWMNHIKYIITEIKSFLIYIDFKFILITPQSQFIYNFKENLIIFAYK